MDHKSGPHCTKAQLLFQCQQKAVQDQTNHLEQLKLSSEIRYYNTRFRATLQRLESVRKGTKSRLRGADLMALFGGYDGADGTVGIAYIGTACWEGRNDARVAIQ